MTESKENLQANRLASIYKALMLFCVLVWLWGFALLKVWPWQSGGEWLPDFPIVAVCADDTVCAVPFGELAAAKAAGSIKTLQPPADNGETVYQMLNVQWKRLGNGIEARVSAWNFQTTVRYRIENSTPILIEYQEISGKLFLFAIGAALLSLLGLYLRKLRKS